MTPHEVLPWLGTLLIVVVLVLQVRILVELRRARQRPAQFTIRLEAIGPFELVDVEDQPAKPTAH